MGGRKLDRPAAGVSIDTLLASLESSDGTARSPIYLVAGDRVLAEPAAARLADVLAASVGCAVETYRRPATLDDHLADLETYALFAPGKVVLASETAVFADLAAAAALVDEATEALPVSADDSELTATERRSALRLLQALRLFELDPYAGAPAELIARIPDWALQGGAAHRKKARRRSRPQVEKLRQGLEPLLERARATGLTGRAESTVATLMEILERGFPEGHHLVLAESSVAPEHPVAQALAKAGALLSVGEIEVDRKGFHGVETIAAELERQTGVGIDRPALGELVRRTLRRRSRGQSVDAESTGRFAAEYRKLATVAGGGTIDRDLVVETVQDRGDEDVWQVLDAIGSGQPAAALDRLDRLMAASEDPIAARLSVFSLIASFCRQVSAVAGFLGSARVAPGERNYHRFKTRIAPRLQETPEGGGGNPLAGLHPFRLHRAYLAASVLPPGTAAALPARVLETELRLKGDSRAPETTLAAFVAQLASAMAGNKRSAGRRG